MRRGRRRKPRRPKRIKPDEKLVDIGERRTDNTPAGGKCGKHRLQAGPVVDWLEIQTAVLRRQLQGSSQVQDRVADVLVSEHDSLWPRRAARRVLYERDIIRYDVDVCRGLLNAITAEGANARLGFSMRSQLDDGDAMV